MSEKREKQTKSKRRIWRGVTTATASLLTLSMSATLVIDGFRTDIDKFLGTQSTKMVTEDVSAEDYTFQSDYSSTTELLDSIEDLGERMNEEGSVLLKNENAALPLSKEETQKISLLGFSSYYPVQGGDFGSTLSENKGTDADTVDMLEAFESKGFEMNPTLKKMYQGLKEEFKSEAVLPWGVTTYYRATAPATTGVFTSLEPETATLDEAEPNWKKSMTDYNVMIVTLARAAGENANYTPGEDGVNPEQDLNQADPLGLSDTERAIIDEAVNAKKENNGKLIVMLNNASAMEIEEIKNNTGVDAILEVGLPGGYGFYGVADVLSGEVNPSGHLADTYAVDNSSSPAAQNYGNYEWTNADSAYSINSEIVEAEGIYTGYKYYETRYADTVLGQGNASDKTGSSNGKAWNYEDEVSYPFGYGLSYTTFAYGKPAADKKVMSADDQISFTVTVKNTGDREGQEVVQLYISDKKSSLPRPVKELKGFKKVKLAPGEEKEVTFTVDKEALSYFDDAQHAWVAEPGKFEAVIAASAADIKGIVPFELK